MNVCIRSDRELMKWTYAHIVPSGNQFSSVIAARSVAALTRNWTNPIFTVEKFPINIISIYTHEDIHNLHEFGYGNFFWLYWSPPSILETRGYCADIAGTMRVSCGYCVDIGDKLNWQVTMFEDYKTQAVGDQIDYLHFKFHYQHQYQNNVV